ncbi:MULTISPECIES: hypothetical protein [Cohaesibacter]|uniref:hypothetical protein n=1 Tax=Cohaesibacter TaxID=655352 RepID=UPI000DEB8876|nr:MULTISPECIES: hypothetical protein [Cohaesibacter]TLP48825.1 hypothetical protein FDK21_03995 [Cohaesibacter sp. CAU 1516]
MSLKTQLIVGASAFCLALGVNSLALAKGAQSPYDTIYEVIADTNLRAAPEAGSKVKVPLDKGTEGVVMRWCRDEFNFRSWAYGSLSKRRAMLKVRVCEVQVNGTIGFVDAKFLDPM